MGTTGSIEQPTPSAWADPRETYVVSKPRATTFTFGALENGESGEQPAALGPSTLPGNLRSSVPLPSISRIPETAPSPYKMELLQMWEGTVTGVGEGEFVARLTDLTAPGKPDEEAEFSRQEVSPGDLARLVEGAVFRWSIGYKTRRGQKERVSQIVFQRLPGWSGKNADAIKEAAAKLESAFPLADPS